MSGDQAQLLPGTLDLLILKAVSLGPLHGYGVLLRIGQISGQALLIEQGALYPALFRLVRQGLLKASWGTSENNRRAKFYELTAAGRKRLREETDGWNRLATAIACGTGRATGGDMSFSIPCARFRGESFSSFARGRRRWRKSFARTLQHRADDLERSGLLVPRPSGGRASSLAAMSATGRSRMRRGRESFFRTAAAGCAVRTSRAGEVAGLHRSCGADAGIGDWGERGGVQHAERAGAASAECAAREEHRHD